MTIRKTLLLSILASCCSVVAFAQADSTLFRRLPTDSLKHTLNMDAIYNRPFLTANKLPIAIGGYMEANWQHVGEAGVSEGHQFQFRRMTIFVASTISKRIKFMSEIEFEPAEKELAIEFAALDFEFNPLFNLRGGMIVNPIGAFNQNHDGPKWEFTDRPIAMTQLLPATWSNAGFGVYGKKYTGEWMFGYEAYLSSGFNSSIINNSKGKTYLPAAKENTERFEESTSGEPLYTGKIAIRHAKVGEIGLSYMGGAYNKYQDDGSDIDERRRLDVFAVDFNTHIPNWDTFIIGEFAWVKVQVPETYTQQYGSRQRGGFIDIVQPIVRGRLLGWDKATLNVACRVEYVDWNTDRFKETGKKIGDDLWSIVPALSFRPNASTVLRLNYRYQEQRDFLSNPAKRLGGFNFGISTYF